MANNSNVKKSNVTGESGLLIADELPFGIDIGKNPEEAWGKLAEYLGLPVKKNKWGDVMSLKNQDQAAVQNQELIALYNKALQKYADGLNQPGVFLDKTGKEAILYSPSSLTDKTIAKDPAYGQFKDMVKAGDISTGNVQSNTLGGSQASSQGQSSGGFLAKAMAAAKASGQPVSNIGEASLDMQAGSQGQGSGQTKFVTGNPELDDWLNNQWLPLIEAEFSSDPTAIFDDEAFKNIKEKVEAAYGPIFANELKLATDAYNLQKGGLENVKSKTDYDLSGQLSKGLDAIQKQTGYVETDYAKSKELIARNYQEALADSKDALAAKNLVFGGTMIKTKQKLAQQLSDQTSALDTAKNKTLDDLYTQKKYLETDIPVEQEFQNKQYANQLAQLESGYTQSKQELDAQKLLQIEKAKADALSFGSQLLQNPQYNQ